MDILRKMLPRSDRSASPRDHCKQGTLPTPLPPGPVAVAAEDSRGGGGWARRGATIVRWKVPRKWTQAGPQRSRDRYHESRSEWWQQSFLMPHHHAPCDRSSNLAGSPCSRDMVQYGPTSIWSSGGSAASELRWKSLGGGKVARWPPTCHRIPDDSHPKLAS